MTLPNAIVSQRSWVSKVPISLRTISGFLSALTSAVISLIFTFTIYDAVLKIGIGYPGEYKIALMIIAPVISSWQFLNVSSTLAALFSNLKENSNKSEAEIAATVGIVTPQDVSIESSIFGSFNVLLRAIAGFVSCITVCAVSLIFTYVMHKGIISGKGYPTNSEMTVVIVGPIIMSWTFMRASTTIVQLLKVESIGSMVKRWIHNVTGEKQKA